jgi:hypothetical protein
VQTVVQILPEPPRLHVRGQIAICGRDHTNVHSASLRTANGLEFAFLKHPQKFGLELQRKFAYFVEEDGSTVRQLKSSGPPSRGTGEGPTLVAEELTLTQCCGNGPTVNPDKGPR